MKNVLISVRVLVLWILLFMPAIAVLMVAAFLSGSTWWFGMVGLPALLINGIIVFAKPQRDRIWKWTNTIAGTNARL